MTAKHSDEWINMIAQAINHGSMWQAMGAGHYTSDDVFWGVAKQNNERKKKELTKKKEIALKKQQNCRRSSYHFGSSQGCGEL